MNKAKMILKYLGTFTSGYVASYFYSVGDLLGSVLSAVGGMLGGG
ncbi:hypothetical protein LCGC14_0472090 [marine sediment metagenome]|uniref:Uncharacterized protein n=1 Tax=marine sediment metagenome TaxID=412755 RepID=A0A0F9SUT8_9ZZZZ